MSNLLGGGCKVHSAFSFIEHSRMPEHNVPEGRLVWMFKGPSGQLAYDVLCSQVLEASSGGSEGETHHCPLAKTAVAPRQDLTGQDADRNEKSWKSPVGS